jgi:hypothetical protein
MVGSALLVRERGVAGAVGMSVTHRSSNGGRRASLLQRGECGGVVVLVCWSKVEPFPRPRFAFAACGASACFASGIE